MIATLSSFATQFNPVLVAAGKTLFEEGKIATAVPGIATRNVLVPIIQTDIELKKKTVRNIMKQ